MTTEQILTVVGLSIAFASLVNGALYQFWILPRINRKFSEFEARLRHNELINQEKWRLKKEACLNALNIADSLLSNYQYQYVQDSDIKPTPVKTEEVRRCFNELACTCESSEVIEVLKTIAYDSVRPDIIVDLRNAVRKELHFGNEDFDLDREKAFVAKIGADPELKD